MNTAIILPAIVIGTKSPYPTVVIVITAQYKPDKASVNGSFGVPCSAYIRVDATISSRPITAKEATS